MTRAATNIRLSPGISRNPVSHNTWVPLSPRTSTRKLVLTALMIPWPKRSRKTVAIRTMRLPLQKVELLKRLRHRRSMIVSSRQGCLRQRCQRLGQAILSSRGVGRKSSAPGNSSRRSTGGDGPRFAWRQRCPLPRVVWRRALGSRLAPRWVRTRFVGETLGRAVGQVSQYPGRSRARAWFWQPSRS